MAVAYQAYHAIKLGARGKVDKAIETGDFSGIYELLFRELNAIASDSTVQRCLKLATTTITS